MPETFTITDEQLAKLNAWIAAKPDKDAYTGAIGGRYAYIFCPTTIGVAVHVKDTLAGDEIDLSDYLDW